MRCILWACTVGLLLPVGVAEAQSSLQARIDAAAPGDTVVVESGTHQGPFVVDRSLTLVGRGRPHLQGDEKAHVITVTASDVTIQGFRITESGTSLDEDHAGVMVQGARATVRDNHLDDVLHGVYVQGEDRAVITENRIEGPPTRTRDLSAGEVSRSDCLEPTGGASCEVPLPRAQRGNGVHLWKSAHSTITHNTIYETRDGVYFSFADHAYAARNTVHNVRYGLHFMYSDDNVFEHNRFCNNESGSALMFSYRLTARHNVFRDNRTQRGYGLLLQTMDESHFVDNRLERNGTGIYLENSTGNVFERNVVAANYRGIRFTGSSMQNRFGQNLIGGNLNTATVAGMSETNTWDLDGVGNYWGPRGLLDLNADGISELPYRTVDLLGSRRNAFPYVDLLAGSPGLALLREALRRVPSPSVPALTDRFPLLQPPVAAAPKNSGRVLIFVVSLALIAVLLWRRRP